MKILEEIHCSMISGSEVKSLSHVRLFATPWTVAYQALPSMGFSRQECWSGLSFPSPGGLSHQGSPMISGVSLCVCVYIFPICSPIEQHLGCLHILATVKDAVVDIGLHMSHEILISIPLNIHSGVVLLDNMLVQF